MGRKGSLEERTRAEVERIKAEEAEREAKLRRSREETAKAEEERTKCVASNRWVANSGAPSEFEAAWPNLKGELLTQHTLEQETQARQLQRTSGVSRI
jgi:hypothetical protein